MEIKGIKYVSPCFDNCYDDKTEVLTDNGWKFFKELSYLDRMATINTNGELEYHLPDDLIVKEIGRAHV
jgi:hypothetical protein